MVSTKFCCLLECSYSLDVSRQTANFWIVYSTGISPQSPSDQGFACLRDFVSSANRAMGNKSLWVWFKVPVKTMEAFVEGRLGGQSLVMISPELSLTVGLPLICFFNLCSKLKSPLHYFHSTEKCWAESWKDFWLFSWH